MSDILLREPADRLEPRIGPQHLADGNWLAFAIACRWVSDLTYVYNAGGGSDLFPYHMESNDPSATNIELKGVSAEELKKVGNPSYELAVVSREPLVPFRHLPWDSFETDQPCDVICLAHSPPFTPADADPVFEEIRRRFIDEMP